MANDYQKPEVHPALAKIAPATQEEEVVRLEGFVGPCDDPSAIRLYSDLESAIYLDIPADAVLHVVEVPDVKNGPIQVYLRGSAKVRLVSTTITTMEASTSILESVFQQGGPRFNIGGLQVAATGDPISDCTFRAINNFQECLIRGTFPNICSWVFQNEMRKCLASGSVKLP